MQADRKAKGLRLSALLAWILVALFLVPVNGFVSVPAAHAESDRPRSNNFFQRLFGIEPRKKDRQRPALRERKPVLKKQRRRPVVQHSTPSEPEKQVVEKLENARKVLVVGDFLAGGVADGLKEAFQELPGVVVIDKSSGSSGFVRDDYFNWPAEMPAFLEEFQPAAVVMMVGSNDRQQMRVGSERLRLRDAAWDKEYQQRLSAFATTVKDRNVPLLWIGAPSFRLSSMSADMLAFNDFYKKAAEDAGGEFIDVWEGFVDENGAFITTGPDINGQPVRLRASDGINLTKAGRRKLAFYAEKPLKKILGDAASPTIGTLGPDNLPQLSIDPAVGIPKIDRTIPMSMNDPALDGGDELLGLVVKPQTELPASPIPVQNLTVEGIAPPPVAGRADDFAIRPVTNSETAPDKTGALR